MHKWKIIKIYFIVLHLLLLFLLWRSDAIEYISKNLNLTKTVVPAEMGNDYQIKLFSHLAWQKLIPDNSVFIFGDSITEYIPPEFLPVDYINLGIGNDTINGIDSRLKYYPSMNKARAIVLAAGINDLQYRPIKDILENYKNLMLKLSNIAPLYINLILPVNTLNWNSDDYNNRNNEKIMMLNQSLIKICNVIKKCNIIDATESLRNSEGYLSTDNHRGDGIHLSKKGYKIWLDILIKCINND